MTKGAMTLPEGRAIMVVVRKPREYVLNAPHPRGRHKARVFRAALGLTERDADWLRSALLRTVATAMAHREGSDH